MATAGFTDVNDFIPEVLQYCNGAPSIMVRKHVTNAIINFCERTLVLKKTPTAFTLEEDEHTYTLEFDSDRYVAIALDNVKVGDDNPMERTTERELDGEASNWRSATSLKPRRYFLTDDINQIRLVPLPSADNDDEDVTMQATVRPKRNQIEFDELLFEKWLPAIKAGALAELLLVKSGSWFDPKQAGIWTTKYKRLINSARKTTLTGTGKYPGRVIPQSYSVVGSGNSHGRALY
jgi:hypothetical protein